MKIILDGNFLNYGGTVLNRVEVAERRHWWISCEPLLGSIDLHLDLLSVPKPDWVVVGCESGSGRRPCALEWVESIVEQCLDAGVRVFVKQLNIKGVCERDIMHFPPNLRIRQTPWSHKILPIDMPNGRKD